MRLKRAFVACAGVLVCAAVLMLAPPAAPLDARGPQPQNPPLTASPLTAEQLVTLADEVAKEVATLRGWTFKQPIRKELTTVAQLREYMERQIDRSVPTGRLAMAQALLRTIGLIPQATDLKVAWITLLENQVGGFYVPETKTMHLIARADLPAFLQRIMLAHELTHALDDQYVDLKAIVELRETATEDLDLTWQAVAEGSATALMMQYAAQAMLAGRVDAGALQQYAQQEAERTKEFLAAPRYFSAMLGAYVCGTHFLARGQLTALMLAPDDKAIGDALLAARKNPPQSTEQVLHPAKYWGAAKRDDPVVIDDQAAARWLAQPGRWIVHADTIGEMLTAILTSPAGSSPALGALQSADAWTNVAAAGWGGDRFYLLADGATAEAARSELRNARGVWLTAWDTPNDRDEFLAALPKGSLAPGATADRLGDSAAVVYFGLDEAERGRLTARLRESPVTMTKGGKDWPLLSAARH